MAIAKLSIDLEARLTNLEAGLKQATSLAEQSAGKMQSAFKGLALTFTGLAGALSLGSLKGAFDKYVDGAVSMQRLAIVTGTTTENISGLAAVAKLSGTEVDQVQGAMVRLSAGMSKANDETKGMGAAFAALQLDPAKLKTMDTADALQEVAKAFAKVEDGSSKTAIAVAIFGKAGAELLPYLKDLASTGALVSKITTEQGQAAKDYQLALKQMELAQGSVAKTIAAELVPAASTFVQELARMVQQSETVRGSIGALAKDGSIRSWAEDAAQALALVADGFANVMHLMRFASIGGNVIKNAIGDMGAAGSIIFSGESQAVKEQAIQGLKAEQEKRTPALLKQIKDTWKAGEGSATPFSDRLSAAFANKGTDRFLSGKSALNAIEHPTKRKISFTGSGTDGATGGGGGRSRAEKAVDDGARLVESLRDQIRNTQELTEVEKLELAISDGKYKTATSANLEIARGYAKTLDQIHANNEAAEKEIKIQQERLAVFAEGARVFAETRTPVEALNIEIERLVKLLDSGALGEGADGLELFGRAAQKAGKEFQAIKDPLSEMDQFAIQAAKNIQDAFAEFLFDPFKNGTQGMLEGFGTAIRKMIANAVAADLGKRLFGDIGSGGGVGGLFGDLIKGLMGYFPSSPSSFFGSDAPLGVIPSGSFAVGTDYVPRDMVAQIHKGERIVPAAENRPGEMGGHSVSVVINMSNGGSANDVRRAGGAVAREVLGALSSSRRYA